MIVYRISVNTVNANRKNLIRMGKSALTRIQHRKEYIENARGKCGKIPNKVCER